MKHKIQIWLREDQVELVAESLKLVRGQLTREGRVAYETLDMAGKFTARRINEILDLIDSKTANPVLPNDSGLLRPDERKP